MGRGWVCVALGALVAGVACDAERESEPAPSQVRSGEVDAERGTSTSLQPQRGRVLGGEKRVRPVAWPSVADLGATREQLPESARRSVDASPVPVLAPSDPAWLRAVTVSVGDHWAAFTAQRDGLTLSLHASGLSHRYDHIRPVRPPHEVRGVGAFVSQNEGIWTVSWIEHGIAYALDLECAPLERYECADDATVRALVDSLEFVGGRGTRGVDR